MCVEYVRDLAKIPCATEADPDETLGEDFPRVVVIGPAKPKHIAGLRKETGFRGAVFVDPGRALYAALGLVCGESP